MKIKFIYRSEYMDSKHGKKLPDITYNTNNEIEYKSFLSDIERNQKEVEKFEGFKEVDCYCLWKNGNNSRFKSIEDLKGFILKDSNDEYEFFFSNIYKEIKSNIDKY